MITKKEAAAELNGNRYRAEGNKALFRAMKEAGLVAVFGASDDLTEFQGAIDDEAGKGKIYIDKNGVMRSECNEGDECPYYRKALKSASFIEATEREGFTHVYVTAIPHETFVIRDDDQDFCRGIVFWLDDVA